VKKQLVISSSAKYIGEIVFETAKACKSSQYVLLGNPQHNPVVFVVLPSSFSHK
jgi:hypothetical protein